MTEMFSVDIENKIPLSTEIGHHPTTEFSDCFVLQPVLQL